MDDNISIVVVVVVIIIGLFTLHLLQALDLDPSPTFIIAPLLVLLVLPLLVRFSNDLICAVEYPPSRRTTG